MHSTRAQDATEPRIDDFATKSEWRARGFVGHTRTRSTEHVVPERCGLRYSVVKRDFGH